MKTLARIGFVTSAFVLASTSHAACLSVPKAGVPAIFMGANCTATSTNVIAATVPSVTSQNSVQNISMPPNVAPPSMASLNGIGTPSGAAAGLLFAIKGDNLSQGTPTSSPPPPPSCACGVSGGYSWSGWDNLGWTGGYSCNPCPPPPSTTGGGGGVSVPSSFTTAYGYTWDIANRTITAPDGTTYAMNVTTLPNGSTQLSYAIPVNGVNTTQTVTSQNGTTAIQSANVTNGQAQTFASYTASSSSGSINATASTANGHKLVDGGKVAAVQNLGPVQNASAQNASSAINTTASSVVQTGGNATGIGSSF